MAGNFSSRGGPQGSVAAHAGSFYGRGSGVGCISKVIALAAQAFKIMLREDLIHADSDGVGKIQ